VSFIKASYENRQRRLAATSTTQEEMFLRPEKAATARR